MPHVAQRSQICFLPACLEQAFGCQLYLSRTSGCVKKLGCLGVTVQRLSDCTDSCKDLAQTAAQRVLTHVLCDMRLCLRCVPAVGGLTARGTLEAHLRLLRHCRRLQSPRLRPARRLPYRRPWRGAGRQRGCPRGYHTARLQTFRWVRRRRLGTLPRAPPGERGPAKGQPRGAAG